MLTPKVTELKRGSAHGLTLVTARRSSPPSPCHNRRGGGYRRIGVSRGTTTLRCRENDHPFRLSVAIDVYASTNFFTGRVCALRNKTLGRWCWSLSASARRGSVTAAFAERQSKAPGRRLADRGACGLVRVAIVGGSLTLVV